MKKVLTCFLFIFLFLNKNFGQNFTTSNLPIVLIETGGQTIWDEPKIMATMRIIARTDGQPNSIFDAPNVYNGQIGIEYRGQSSQWYDKKPYTIELRNADTTDRAVSLLGMPEESDWALIQPLNDKSLMRDVLAHHLAGEIMDWAPRTRYCEVVLNGNYVGVYVLLEKIKRDANRVNIAKLEEKDTADLKLTGGYLLSMDKWFGGGPGGDWASIYPPFQGSTATTFFQLIYPKPEDRTPQQLSYIKNHLHDFEKAMADWQPNNGGTPIYEDWIDASSWINFLLINEISKNTDGYRLSSYFSKDRDDRDPRLKMGPVWDFNIAFGIGDYCEGQFTSGWAKDFNDVCGGDSWVIHFWWEKLCRDTVFQKKTVARWQSLRQTIWSNDRLNFTVDSLAGVISEAQFRNFQRWPVLGQYVWPNSFIGQTWQQEVDYLKTFLKNRVAWMDANVPKLDLTALPAFPDLLYTRVFPNPLPAGQALVLEFSNDFDVATFSLFDSAGRQVIKSEKLPKGNRVQHKIQLPSLGSGVYFYKINVGNDQVKEGKIVVQ